MSYDPKRYEEPAEREAEPVAWRDVPGYEDEYCASSIGEIMNKRTGRVLAKNKMGAGYIKADLWKNVVRTQTSAHRVIALTFHGPDFGREVNHIDGNKENNRVENLEWCDKSDNRKHAIHVLNHPMPIICQAKPIVSIDVVTNEIVEYSSIEDAVSHGFTSAHIYRCLKNPHRTHRGKRWFRPESRPASPCAKYEELLNKGAEYYGETIELKHKLAALEAENAKMRSVIQDCDAAPYASLMEARAENAKQAERIAELTKERDEWMSKATKLPEETEAYKFAVNQGMKFQATIAAQSAALAKEARLREQQFGSWVFTVDKRNEALAAIDALPKAPNQFPASVWILSSKTWMQVFATKDDADKFQQLCGTNTGSLYQIPAEVPLIHYEANPLPPAPEGEV